MQPQVTTYSYGNHGIVALLQQHGNLSQIHTSSDQEFWVKTEKLKVKHPKVKYSATEVPELDDAVNAWERFVVYLQESGYCFELYAKGNHIDEAAALYAEWAGESLPDDIIRIYENRPTDFCFRLFFKIPDGMKCPFQLDLAGTGTKKPTDKPRGLWHPKTGRVEVYFTSIIEQLVRAGLRATA